MIKYVYYCISHLLCLNLCPAFLFFILKIVMDMEIQILNFRKESLSKLRLLIFLSLSVFSFSVKAVGNVVNNANVDSLISGIGYDYQTIIKTNLIA